MRNAPGRGWVERPRVRRKVRELREGKRDGDWGVSPVGIRRKHKARGKREKKKKKKYTGGMGDGNGRKDDG